jgi:hypothetical protein
MRLGPTILDIQAKFVKWVCDISKNISMLNLGVERIGIGIRIRLRQNYAAPCGPCSIQVEFTGGCTYVLLNSSV